MARQYNNARPKDLRYTVGKTAQLHGPPQAAFAAGGRAGRRISALGNLLATYMIRPVVNDLVDGDLDALIQGVDPHRLHSARRGRAQRPGLHADDGQGRPEGALRHPPRPLFPPANAAPALFRHPQARRHHELLHRRCGHHLRRPQQQLRHAHPELHPDHGHAAAPLHPQLAAVAVRGAGLSGHVPLHPLQRPAAARPITAISSSTWASSTATSRRWSAARRSSRSSTTRRRT